MKEYVESVEFCEIRQLVSKLSVPQKTLIAKDLLTDLPIEARAEVVKEAIGKNNDLAVVFGNNWATAQTVVNIQNEDLDFGKIFEAIAEHVENNYKT